MKFLAPLFSTAVRVVLIVGCGCAVFSSRPLRAQVEEELPIVVRLRVTSTGYLQLNGVTFNSGGHGSSQLVGLQPFKAYTSTALPTGTTVNFYPPAGYSVWVDGAEQLTFTDPSTIYAITYYHTIELRPKTLFAPASIGEATGIQFKAPVTWGVSLGNLINGQSAGHIFLYDTTPVTIPDYFYDTRSGISNVPIIYTPAALFCTKESAEVTIYSPGQVRQVKTWQGLADVVAINAYTYEIRFYRPEDVSGSSAPYSVSGTPFAKYTIGPAVDDYYPEEDGNPEYHFVGGLRITKTVGSRTEVSDLTYSETNGDPNAVYPYSIGTWRLTTGGGARVEEKSKRYPLDHTTYDEETGITTYYYNTATPYYLHQIKNASGTVITEYHRYYTDFYGISHFTKKIAGPNTATPVTTTYTYDGTSALVGLDVMATNESTFGQMLSMSCSDGGFCRYDYYTASDRIGRLWRMVRPAQDSPASVGAIASPTPDGTVTTYDYAADWTGRKVLVSSMTNNAPTRHIDSTITTSASSNSQPLNGVSSTCYYDSTHSQNVTASYYRQHLYDTVYVNMPYSNTWADGRRDAMAYHMGDFDESTHAFTLNSSGRAWRATTLHGWKTNVASAGTAFSTIDSQTVETVYLVPNKSTKDVIYRNTKANIVRTERYVYTSGGTFELLDGTNYTYNDASKLTGTSSSNGAQTTVGWTDGLKSYEIDETGIRTEYTYDVLARVLAKTKKGISGTGIDTQGDIITTYEYDADGHTTKQTVAGGTKTLVTSNYYDTAGRLTLHIEPGSVSTSYSYSNGGRTVTKTLPNSATEITDRYQDGRVKSITGTGVVGKYYSYSGDTETIHYGASALSSRVSESTRDDLGRVVTEKPNPSWTKTYSFNANGQLTKVSEQLGTSTNLPPALTVYNDYAEPYRTGIDANNDGTLDPGAAAISGAISNGDEKVSENTNDFVKDGSDWWLVRKQQVYSVPYATTLITTNTSKTRLTGFASGVFAETQSIDVYGNVTTTKRVVDASSTAKKVITRVTYPDSSVDEETTLINGLAVTRRTKENLTFSTKSDELGRTLQTKDPRHANWSSVTYKTGTSWIETATDAAGNVTTYHYNGAGQKDWEMNALSKKTYFSYTPRGESYRVWGDVPYPVEYVYDDYGAKSKMRTFRSGSSWNNSTWPGGTYDETQWTYEAATGFLASKIYPSGDTIQYANYENGQLKTKTNARAQTISYSWTYDYGAALPALRSGGPGVTDAYSYNRLGFVAATSSNIMGHTFTYDLATTLELTADDLSSAAGSKRYAPQYETTGVVGRKKGFKLGTGSAPEAEEVITYGYDTSGRLATIETNFGGGAFDKTTTYAYTSNSNLLASISTPTSGTDVFGMARLYEANRDLMTTVSAAINTSTVKAAYTYAYDELGRRASVIQSGEMFMGYENDSDPGLVEKYTYNDRSELTAANTFVGNTTASTTALPGRDWSYAYDPIGNRMSTATNGRSALSYTTNSNNQYSSRQVADTLDVSGVADTTGTVTVNSTALTSGERSYWYYSHATSFTPTTAPLYAGITVSYGSTTESGSKLLAMPSESMSYDADGNLTADGQWDYTWDAVNRLTAMQTRDAAVALGVPKQKLEFVYDEQDRRVQKKVSGWVSGAWSTTSDTRFIYDGWNVIAEYDAFASAVTRRYSWGVDFSGTLQGAGGVGGLLVSSLKDSGGTWRTYYAAHDGRGNVTALVNASSGALAAAYEYDPFGRTLRASVDTTLSAAEQDVLAAHPWRFSTKYYDQETGLSYFGLRYYSPSQGRFLGRDPSEEKGGLNLYGFCLNNAINGWDHLGMEGVMYADGSGGEVDPGAKMAVSGMTLGARVATGMASLATGWVDAATDDMHSSAPSANNPVIGTVRIVQSDGSVRTITITADMATSTLSMVALNSMGTLTLAPTQSNALSLLNQSTSSGGLQLTLDASHAGGADGIYSDGTIGGFSSNGEAKSGYGPASVVTLLNSAQRFDLAGQILMNSPTSLRAWGNFLVAGLDYTGGVGIGGMGAPSGGMGGGVTLVAGSVATDARLVIGRGADLAKSGALVEGEATLKWTPTGAAKTEWQNNSSLLRTWMNDLQPIRDASPGNTGGMYLNAERNLLQNHGWTFDSQTNLWMPPKG